MAIPHSFLSTTSRRPGAVPLNRPDPKRHQSNRSIGGIVNELRPSLRRVNGLNSEIQDPVAVGGLILFEVLQSEDHQPFDLFFGGQAGDFHFDLRTSASCLASHFVNETFQGTPEFKFFQPSRSKLPNDFTQFGGDPKISWRKQSSPALMLSEFAELLDARRRIFC